MNGEFYWVKILNHYTKKGYVTNGLTLPFLIGGYNHYSKAENAISVEKIISKFLDYEIPITLMKCPKIDEYIFNIMDFESSKIRNYFRQIDNIYITDSSLKNIKSTNELISFLELRYSDNLKQNYFSKDDITLKWRKFDIEEVSKIKESLL